MAKVKKIEDRTRWFIDEYDRLSKEGRLPSNVELARVMGINSKSAVTNILKGDQNIQPAHWDKFKQHFNIGSDKDSSKQSEREPTTMEMVASLTEGFRAIAETMRSIESKMAQESTQAIIQNAVKKLDDKTKEIDTNLIRTLAGVERIAIVQDRSQIELLDYLARIKDGKALPSRGEDRKKHRTDGDGQKRGKSPA